MFFACTDKEQIPDIRVVDSDSELMNGVLYHKKQIFSGYMYNTYPNGTTKKEIQYLEGRKHGYEKHWFSNDSLAIERYYTNGIKTGVHRSWWQDGQQKFVYHFNEKGVYNGKVTEWYPDDQLAKAFHYVDGDEDGAQKLFKPNGAIKANYEVIYGERYGLIGLKKCYTVKKDSVTIY